MYTIYSIANGERVVIIQAICHHKPRAEVVGGMLRYNICPEHVLNALHEV